MFCAGWRPLSWQSIYGLCTSAIEGPVPVSTAAMQSHCGTSSWMSLAKMSQDVSDICVGRAVLLVGCKIQSFARPWMFDSDQAAEKEVQGEPVGPPRKNSLQNALPLGLASLAPFTSSGEMGSCDAQRGCRSLGVLQHLPWLVGDQHWPRIKGTCLLGRAVQSGAICWVMLSLLQQVQSLKSLRNASFAAKSWCRYGSIPINTIFRGMNIHLPAILMFTRGTIGFDTLPCLSTWILTIGHEDAPLAWAEGRDSYAPNQLPLNSWQARYGIQDRHNIYRVCGSLRCQERRQNRSKVNQKLSADSWNFMKLESAGLIHAQLILTAYNGVLQQEYEVLWSHTSSPTDFESRAVVCCRPFRSWQIWIVDNITVIGAGYWYAHPTLYNWHVLACFALGCWWMLPVF